MLLFYLLSALLCSPFFYLYKKLYYYQEVIYSICASATKYPTG